MDSWWKGKQKLHNNPWNQQFAAAILKPSQKETSNHQFNKFWEGINLEVWNDELVHHSAFAVSFVTLLEEMFFVWYTRNRN